MDKPKKLYQYQGINNYSLQNLKNHQIFFNSPLNFNDPYDCLHTIKVEPLSINSIAQTFGETYDSIELEKLTTKILDNSINRQELFEFNITLAKKQGKPIDFINRLSEEIQNEKNFESLKEEAKMIITEQLNSIIHKIIDKTQKDMASNYGISCFSETNDDLQMWAYYGDGHKGFCLEFDTSTETFTKVKKVNYRENAPIISYEALIGSEETNSDEDIIEILLCTKYAQWKNEKEWRLIHREANTKFGYSSKSLSGIYFGAKIDKTNMEIIMTILKSQNPFVKFYCMEKDLSSFKIKSVELNYLTHLQGQQLFFDHLISTYSNNKFQISEVLGKLGNFYTESNILTYFENLIDLNYISKDGEYLRITA